MSPRNLATFIASALVFISTAAEATPKAGTRELRLGQQYRLPTPVTEGLTHSSNGRANVTSLGVSAGYGHFFTDSLELGLLLNGYVVDGFGAATTAFGAEPFLRFMRIKGQLGQFVELVAGVQRSSIASGATLFDVGADLGVELFVTDSWSVRVAPGYRRIFTSSDGFNRFGVSWGLACYF